MCRICAFLSLEVSFLEFSAIIKVVGIVATVCDTDLSKAPFCPNSFLPNAMRTSSRKIGLEVLESRILADSGIGDGSVFEGITIGAIVPDFTLPDINPTSPSFNQIISPRDYQGTVSAWYFGHAT